MAIPIELLRLTDSRAVGICPYGSHGVLKTNAIHTLIPPILSCDFEGGSSSIMPWIRRRRNWDSREWVEYSQEERERVYEMGFGTVEKAQRPYTAGYTGIKPAPYIDVISFDPMEPKAYLKFYEEILSLDTTFYNSVAIDPLFELSTLVQSFTKGLEWGAEKVDEPMQINLWAGVQERTKIALRRLRSYRDKGVFIYLTCSEDIEKDYVKDPRELKKGEKQEAYAVRGTVNLPGKLIKDFQHLIDILFHAKMANGSPAWVIIPESLPAGGAYWEVKDRTGRIKSQGGYHAANIKNLLGYIYGEETRDKMYVEGKSRALSVSGA